MKGYLMNFFKYGVVDKDDFEPTDEMYKNAHGGEDFIRSVVWSVFDRLEIRDITRFNQFRLSQYSEKKWVGERQFALLYEINHKNRNLIYRKSKDKCRFVFHKAYDEDCPLDEQERDERKYKFFGISMVDLAPEVHYDFFSMQNSGMNMHTKIYDIIERLRKDNNIDEEKLCYEIYGTLGGNDLVIIWLANDYVDVITLIEAMRKSRIKNTSRSLLANIYTIMGFRDINNPNITYESMKGKFNIRLTKKGTYNHKDFTFALKKFMKNKIHMETTLGEHDISIRINDIELAKEIYKDEGLVHIRNDNFFDSIFQANTEISVGINYQKLKFIEYKPELNLVRTIVPKQEKERVYGNIEYITKNKLFDALPYLKETLWILYEDYLKNISSTFSYPWIGDLQYQFSQSINYLKDLVDVDETLISKNVKYTIIRDMIGIVRQTMLHVSQANRLFFEIPSTHLRNTGSYSKVLRTYYGIVKQLLLQAYLIPKNERQASIVPFITFDVIPKIISSKLPQLKDSDNIIINIVLPYEALVEIPKYAKLLAHELFHYIAPRNRERRNIQIGIICVSLFFTQILKKYLGHILQKSTGEEDKTKEYFNDKIDRRCLEFVCTNYKELTIDMKKHGSDIWDDYFSKLDSYYSPNSASFAYKYDTHKRIFSLLESIVNAELNEKSSNNYIVEGELSKLENISEEDFCDWVRNDSYKNITDIISIVKYSLREAMADYFMIQVINEQTRIEDYYSLNLDYEDLLESRESGLDLEQELRIGIITDILFNEITDKIEEVSKKQFFEKELYRALQEKAKISEAKVRRVILCFAKYYETLKEYRGIIKLYLTSLQFENIENDKFEMNLQNIVKLFDESGEDDFLKSIKYIEKFQVQCELKDFIGESGYKRDTEKDIIKEIQGTLGIQPVGSIMKDKGDFYATNVIEVMKCIISAINEVKDSDTFEPIWFRGHASCEYKLLPSLYRMKDEKGEFYKGVTLREVIEPLYNAFKVKAFGASEMFQGANNSRIGILASMQHYSVPTNILDWTPEALIALYFAVEEYMVTNEKEKQKRESPQKDAELWILNPIRLNQARKTLLKRPIDNLEKEYPLWSINGDEEQYKEYIPFSRTDSKPYNLPVAVSVPFINQRIKAQAGTFTMFSLDEPQESLDGTGRRFEDLVEMQYRYKANEKEYKPFLTSIRISRHCVHDLADWLRNMGIMRSKIYPDLENICKSLTGEIRDYWDKNEK